MSAAIARFNRRKPVRWLLGVYALLVAGPLAATAAQTGQPFATTWFVEPTVMEVPAEPLSEHQIFYRARIYPGAAFALDDKLPVIDPKDKDTPVTELIDVSNSKDIGCGYRVKSKTKHEKLFIEYVVYIYQCYVDRDRDGAFDGHFSVVVDSREDSGQGYVGSYPMALIQGTLPAEINAIQPVRYHSIPGKSFSRNIFLYYGYDEHHSLVKEFGVGMAIESEDRNLKSLKDSKYGYLSFTLHDRDIPLNLPLPGANYKIEAMIDGKLRVSYDSPSANNIVCVGFKCHF